MPYLTRFIPIAVGLLMLASSPISASYLIHQDPLDPLKIPKYQDPLPEPRKLEGEKLRIDMSEFKTQILPKGNYPKTSVYGYGRSYPGPTVEAERHKPTTVIWDNKIDFRNSVVQKLVKVDQTLHWADPLDLGCHMNSLKDPMCFKPYRGPVPAVAHLHGGEVPSVYDGGPDSWYTKKYGKYGVLKGPAFETKKFVYPNTQEAATLWYHDHGLGITRLNVFSGMSGFYLLRDWEHVPTHLPGGPDDCRRGHGHGHDHDDDHHGRYGGHGDDDDDGRKRKRKQKHRDCPYEREIVIQDRMFDTKAQLMFPSNGNNPDIHPFWRPAFLGNVIVVNGKSWPYMDVEPRRYRLRLLNGSNSRGYRLRIETAEQPAQYIPIWQIGTDGGLLDKPVQVMTPGGPVLTLAPGERADVIVDFAGLHPGQKLVIKNIADNAMPNTTDQVMELRVKHLKAKDRSYDPSKPGAHLRKKKDRIPRLDPEITGVDPDAVRMLTLNGVGNPLCTTCGPQALLLNNSTWLGLDKSGDPVPGSERIEGATDHRLPWTTELPKVGTTEIWRFVNITTGGHPIHLHLAQFQVLDRKMLKIDPDTGRPLCYQKVYADAFGGKVKAFNGPPLPYNEANSDGEIGGNPTVPADCIVADSTMPPASWEDGWKDTVRVPFGSITRIAVRWAPTDLPSKTGNGVHKCPKGNVLLDHPEALPCVPRAGSNLFAFDPSAGLNVKDDGFGYPGGPGYVWHCHILDHEDNEMMRALFVENKHGHNRKHKHRHNHKHEDKHEH
ncbi:MAG: multicopper oxidase domain-containing protein [Gammaproteobacteria bacterium]|nr:multicopper oxidase domain-containing protein [Gammaproteobacteria bacterium]